MRLMTQKNHYNLRVEPGDTINIVFDPDGINAIVGEENVVQALTIGSINIPDGGMALSFHFASGLLYKSRPLAGAHPGLIAYDDIAYKLEFILNQEAPKITLVLEKIDLGELLKDDQIP